MVSLSNHRLALRKAQDEWICYSSDFYDQVLALFRSLYFRSLSAAGMIDRLTFFPLVR